MIKLQKLTDNQYLWLVGSGEGTTGFASIGKNYDAIDIDDVELIALNSKLKALNSQTQFQIYNDSFIEHDFGVKKYDLIIMNNFLNVIPHADIQDNLQKAFNLLNVGCLISVKVNTDFKSEIDKIISHRKGKELAPLKFYDACHNKYPYYNYFSKSEMENYLIEANFVIQECLLEGHYDRDGNLEAYFNFIAAKCYE